MIFLIAGSTHAGKTVFAQRLLELYHYPYLSIDHLKMGLIRSGQTALTPDADDELLIAYLWPIIREIIKTAIENKQHLIIEGCYLPFDWKKSFNESYLHEIHFLCLILSQSYIEQQFSKIRTYANVIEQRLDDCSLSLESMKQENRKNLKLCRQYGCDYLLIKENYEKEVADKLNSISI